MYLNADPQKYLRNRKISQKLFVNHFSDIPIHLKKSIFFSLKTCEQRTERILC